PADREMAYRIYCDFDGTIATSDVTDVLLEAFAAPGWRDIEAQWQAGLIGSAVCMARQVALLHCSRPALDHLLDAVDIDPGFVDFVAFCRDHDIEPIIVSDGLDYAIRRILSRVGLGDLPVIANRLMFLAEDRHAMLSPYASSACHSAAGTCKCEAVRSAGTAEAHTTILIGDGRSDYCAAGVVDLVFAKAGLREHCQANGIVHLPYADFAEVTRLLAERLPNLGAAGLADLPTHAPSGAFLGQEKQAALLEAGIPGRVLP
ncbi:MtnX-like HAD-IB family phosphatase, partial [Labrys neptuniae]|uniref:MtnX-like HAD-IB family phosphatase n=1 Tax=Labrys neptuniae TaxID=376174 RepID=UPI0028927594